MSPMLDANGIVPFDDAPHRADPRYDLLSPARKALIDRLVRAFRPIERPNFAVALVWLAESAPRLEGPIDLAILEELVRRPGHFELGPEGDFLTPGKRHFIETTVNAWPAEERAALASELLWLAQPEEPTLKNFDALEGVPRSLHRGLDQRLHEAREAMRRTISDLADSAGPAGPAIKRLMELMEGLDAQIATDYARVLDSLAHENEALTYDPNTGAFRGPALGMKFNERLEQIRAAGHSACLVHVDLNGLKVVNDAMSDADGTLYIKLVAAALSAHFRVETGQGTSEKRKEAGLRDNVYSLPGVLGRREGGDELDVLVEAVSPNQIVPLVLERLALADRDLRAALTANGISVVSGGFAAGVTIAEPGEDAAILMARATLLEGTAKKAVSNDPASTAGQAGRVASGPSYVCTDAAAKGIDPFVPKLLEGFSAVLKAPDTLGI